MQNEPLKGGTTLRILFLGDIFGSAGREALHLKLKEIKNEHKIDFTIVNGENSAGGLGITPQVCDELLSCGVDVVTSGNHIWRHKEIFPYLKESLKLLRPANYPSIAPGKGFGIYETRGVKLGVINLLGRVFMEPIDCPFKTVDNILENYFQKVNIIVVDFHAEATSEKQAMAWYLDGRVSAVIGTHTHVQTSDAIVLPSGTGYITDIGMTGPHLSIIGMDKDLILERFITGIPTRWKPAKDWIRIEGVVIEVRDTGKCSNIYPIRYSI